MVIVKTFLLLVALSFCSTVSADLNFDLLAAIRSGEVAEVTMILEGGADVNTCNRDGLTALCIAAKKVNRKGGLGSHADIVRFLLKQGGDPALPDADEPHIVYAAGVANNRNLLRLLIEAGADLEVNAPHTALYWAARPARGSACAGVSIKRSWNPPTHTRRLAQSPWHVPGSIPSRNRLGIQQRRLPVPGNAPCGWKRYGR